jgi:hypothetical protein
MIVFPPIIYRMRNISDKMCRENQNTNFVLKNFFPVSRAVYEIMWEKCGTAGQATDDDIIRSMRFAC